MKVESQRSEANIIAISFVAMLVGLLLLAKAAFGADNRGSSDLGLCHPKYDYAKFISKFKNATAIRTRWLDNTFNPSGCPNAALLMKEPKKLDISVHIINGPGLRNGRLERHEIHAGYTVASLDKAVRAHDQRFMNKFKVRLAKLKQLTDSRVGEISLAVDPCLECDLSAEARKILLQETRNYFPNAQLIDNPLRPPCLAGYVCEQHSNSARPGSGGIADLDGTDYDTIDTLNYGRKNVSLKQVLAWKLCNNGFKKGESWIAPSKRINFCGTRDSQDIGYWLRPEALEVGLPIAPSDKVGCKAFYEPRDGEKKDFVWKLGDGRNFAVALFPKRYRSRFRKVEVRRGGVFDTGHYRGLYTEDGTNRLIYDFTQPLANFRDNSVLFADGQCWVLEKPQFRID